VNPRTGRRADKWVAANGCVGAIYIERLCAQVVFVRVLEAADGERINDKQKAKDSACDQRCDRHHQQQLEIGAGGDVSKT
jgi:hypothetical protein